MYRLKTRKIFLELDILFLNLKSIKGIPRGCLKTFSNYKNKRVHFDSMMIYIFCLY